MRRVTRLLEEGVSGDDILVSTFTRTSALDLVRELGKIGAPGAGDVQASTLHSFCFRLLHHALVFEITRRHPRPLLAYEERFMVEDLKLPGSFGGVYDIEERLRAFGADWARLQSEAPGWPHGDDDVAFHGALMEWLLAHEAILVEELIPLALHYLRDNPAAPIRPQFAHVIVDEYQDLNRAEQALLDILASQGDLTIVGDEDQSIYSFKYANRDAITDFHLSHPHTTDEMLIECRRCPSVVVEMANAIIGRNATRSNRVLVPSPGAQVGDVHRVQWASPEDEASGLANFLRRRIDEGAVSPGQALVLAPRREFGRLIVAALGDRGITSKMFFNEHELDGNPKALGESQAQQTLSLLSLLVNEEDRVSLRCWLGFGSPNLRAPAWSRLLNEARAANESPRAVLVRDATSGNSVAGIASLRPRWGQLESELTRLRALRGRALSDALFPPTEEWAGPFREMVVDEFGDQDFDEAALRDCIVQRVSQPDLPTDVDYVRVMSLHKSKGLTADLVMIAACNDGLLPSLYDDKSHLDPIQYAEEQRRVMFVGITRTRRTLVLSSVATMRSAWAHKWQLPIVRYLDGDTVLVLASPHLNEMGPTCPPAVDGANWVPGAPLP